MTNSLLLMLLFPCIAIINGLQLLDLDSYDDNCYFYGKKIADEKKRGTIFSIVVYILLLVTIGSCVCIRATKYEMPEGFEFDQFSHYEKSKSYIIKNYEVQNLKDNTWWKDDEN